MAATIIDGKVIAAKHKEAVRQKAELLKARGITPCLAVVLVGEDPASVSYVTGKHKALFDTGMEGRPIRLPEIMIEEELLDLIRYLNADKTVHGILVQLPLPPHINEDTIINAIDPAKDVDCFHPLNMGKLLLGQKGFLPCTPHGIVVLLEELKIPLKGSHTVIIGRSNIVGKPLLQLLARRGIDATVTLCHTGTKDLASFTRQADILIPAAGVPGLITADMIKKGAAVIDVGIRQVPDSQSKTGYRLTGDVAFEEALEVAGWLTPVPGGAGPMTIAMLMRNVLQAAEEQNE